MLEGVVSIGGARIYSARMIISHNNMQIAGMNFLIISVVLSTRKFPTKLNLPYPRKAGFASPTKPLIWPPSLPAFLPAWVPACLPTCLCLAPSLPSSSPSSLPPFLPASPHLSFQREKFPASSEERTYKRNNET